MSVQPLVNTIEARCVWVLLGFSGRLLRLLLGLVLLEQLRKCLDRVRIPKLEIKKHF